MMTMMTIYHHGFQMSSVIFIGLTVPQKYAVIYSYLHSYCSHEWVHRSSEHIYFFTKVEEITFNIKTCLMLNQP